MSNLSPWTNVLIVVQLVNFHLFSYLLMCFVRSVIGRGRLDGERTEIIMTDGPHDGLSHVLVVLRHDKWSSVKRSSPFQGHSQHFMVL